MSALNPVLFRAFRALLLLAACGAAGSAIAADQRPARLGDVLTFPIPGAPICDATAIDTRLLLDGLDTGLRPLGCDPATNSLSYRVARRDAQGDVDAAWSVFLRKPWDTPKGDFARGFQLTLAKQDAKGVMTPIYSKAIRLIIVRKSWLALGFVLIALAWISVAVAGKRSGMLRDANSTAAGTARPYSLARVQMAWWFALVIGAYVFLWVLTDDLAQFNTSVLALLGISGATGLSAAGIDSASDRKVPETSNFFVDILTDVNGITLARLQLLMWNLVIGAVFVSRVFTDLEMPNFDATTLGLIGLSGGAYVGFKVPEKQTKPDAPQ